MTITAYFNKINGSSANMVSRNIRGGRGNGRGRGRDQQGTSRKPTNNNGGTRPMCQVCDKIGHSALKCYHRYDQSYQAEEGRVAAVANTTPSYNIDTNWYTDTGATDQITSELDRLTVKEKYTGKDQVQTANGSGSNYEENTSSREM